MEAEERWRVGKDGDIGEWMFGKVWRVCKDGY